MIKLSLNRWEFFIGSIMFLFGAYTLHQAVNWGVMLGDDFFIYEGIAFIALSVWC